ncbi:xanthine dehydrogenase family protein molybdopterin-binding subunit [Sulfitobacter guttiformis]|uniref:Xanthine dehydrogenase YagR molybdenum-binding subunit n=1 Tax=Sulfitobacter guttiformis TaxID=74349 RepID=A0A420DPN9_9RHOB|nr:xanthine dehydrogenase family protein molybdopterin-binding subunit [Sulfitobacter guttiformis]KIN73479.1 Oxidoreductase [Sulfitobacter guttiformis KCTC 32187]RKE96139.1 xanthine dehydrogenase YagR molybdenum-binding subunit [Sulfitobacter guttiformis]
MTVHHKMDRQSDDVLSDMAQGVIGTGAPRVDGPAKVTGQAKYAAEIGDGTEAVGVFVRATIAKGSVKSVDKAAALAMSGVVSVITDERLLRNPAQGTANEAPIQGASAVSYFGQPIALVVAESFEQARHAAQHITVEYDADDAVTDPTDENAQFDVPDEKQTEQGDVSTAMAQAAFSVDVNYTTPSQNSAAMEPHASIAQWEGDELTLHGSYQMLKYNRNELADALGIAAKHVRIVAPYVGGGFGSKLGIAPEAVAAAIAAKELGRPVRVVMTRPQVFETTMRRSSTQQRLRLAADSDGNLTAIGHDATVSNLPGEEFSEPVALATHFLYAGKNRSYAHRIARIHRTCAGSMRAPGEAVGMLALENAMDELAHKAGIDPVALRVQNIPEKHPESDKEFSSRRFAECLTQGAEKFGWSARSAVPGQVRDGEWLIGMGVSSAARGNILSEAKARVILHADASVTIETDMTDIGTGSYTIFGQIAAEMLGLPLSSVTVKLGDTDYPEAAGSGGSWGASSVGSAVFLACQSLRGDIAKLVGTDAADITLKDGVVTAGNVQRPLSETLSVDLIAVGHIEPGDMSGAVEHAGFGAHFAEVGVNAVTGETRVRRMLGVFSAGRILNEQTARSQCYGGMIFGIGAALTEEMVHDHRDGHIVNHNLAEYHIPVNLDVPQLEVEFLEERDSWANPIQAKGVGELGISGAGAAITNAIFNATGVRVRDYPATLDKILSELPEA